MRHNKGRSGGGGGDKAVVEMCRGSMAAVSQRQQTHNCHLFLTQVITFTHSRMRKDREREGRWKERAEGENEPLKE